MKSRNAKELQRSRTCVKFTVGAAFRADSPRRRARPWVSRWRAGPKLPHRLPSPAAPAWPPSSEGSRATGRSRLNHKTPRSVPRPGNSQSAPARRGEGRAGQRGQQKPGRAELRHDVVRSSQAQLKHPAEGHGASERFLCPCFPSVRRTGAGGNSPHNPAGRTRRPSGSACRRRHRRTAGWRCGTGRDRPRRGRAGREPLLPLLLLSSSCFAPPLPPPPPPSPRPPLPPLPSPSASCAATIPAVV